MYPLVQNQPEWDRRYGNERVRRKEKENTNDPGIMKGFQRLELELVCHRNPPSRDRSGKNICLSALRRNSHQVMKEGAWRKKNAAEETSKLTVCSIKYTHLQNMSSEEQAANMSVSVF
ncbi:unnamed protein product [Pleuronectes platessa]|uniref:Uncharacterized protein n=1 Tax=Pleuronectes platessa TaxID=8262 RepID=A0A9N7YQV7_PLEPL|nr:unnamed protein product [Pleuronectes platessa]